MPPPRKAAFAIHQIIAPEVDKGGVGNRGELAGFHRRVEKRGAPWRRGFGIILAENGGYPARQKALRLGQGAKAAFGEQQPPGKI